MFDVRIRLVGAPKKGGDAKRVIAAATAAFVRRQGEVYLRFMQTEAPVGATGLLSRSHILRVINQYRAEVANTASYAQFVHEGTAPHMPPASSGLPYPVRLFIARHGTRPNPWMARAAEMGDREIQQNMDHLMADIAKEIFRG
jgi:hypothetical protein